MSSITNLPKSYKKKYKCPYCESRLERNKLPDHIEKHHKELIPQDYTATRVAFNTINHKTVGSCIICGKETDWNETKKRYERLCNNPRCKQSYIKMTEERLKKSRGITKSEMLSDPEFQNKMLKNRSISGSYKFSDGGKIDYVGSYEKNFLEFMDKFLKVESKDIQSPGPTIEYYYEGKKHFWITDFYYIPYNIVLDIKDGGKNPNTREMPSYRAKQYAKEKAIKDGKMYNYIRLTDNQFDQLLEMMFELKDGLMELEEPYRKNILKVKPIVKIYENYIRLLNDYKDPKNCSWDEEMTYNTILDALQHDKIDTTKPMYVYDMDPNTYKITYLGSITSSDGESYSWKERSKIDSVKESDMYIPTNDKLSRLLCKCLTDPNTYKNKDLSEIKTYVSKLTDRHDILDANTWLTTAIIEHCERFMEYYKYLRSGKCVWQYQMDCEAFRNARVSLDDVKYILDYLEEIKTIAMELLTLPQCNNMGYYVGTNDNIEELKLTPKMIDTFYNKLKEKLGESEIETIDDFDLYYFHEYVI